MIKENLLSCASSQRYVLSEEYNYGNVFLNIFFWLKYY